MVLPLLARAVTQAQQIAATHTSSHTLPHISRHITRASKSAVAAAVAGRRYFAGTHPCTREHIRPTNTRHSITSHTHDVNTLTPLTFTAFHQSFLSVLYTYNSITRTPNIDVRVR
jgi:hypothetical protein